jgi:CheY-like chemotaxis protein
MMGGDIHVNSEEGRGSEFYFTATFKKQQGEERHPLPPAQKSDLKGLSVMVVDDNETNRQVISTQLQAWEMIPTAYPDGPGALEGHAQAIKKGQPFDLAILDMQMPEMDGLTLARRIQEQQGPTPHLIMMTSVGQVGDARRFKKAGFAAYLVKPVGQQDILDTLTTVVSGKPPCTELQPIITRHTVREMRRKNIRILLAEDNMVNQHVAVNFLKKIGHTGVDTVKNGKEAIKALETIPYDLVLMDVQMPEMDGIEATRVIRDVQSGCLNHAIPIIAMTAHAMKSDRDRCLEAGMNDHITKPVNPKILATTIEKWSN